MSASSTVATSVSKAACARDDFADARCGYPDGLGQSVLADAQWFEELFLKKFTRADGWETIHGAFCSPQAACAAIALILIRSSRWQMLLTSASENSPSGPVGARSLKGGS